MEICPIILCGGEGTRLWPVSRRDSPKQFAALIGEHSCFQQAVLRLHGMAGVRSPIIVAGEAHEATVRRQLAAIGVDATVIVEPEGRDSAPATAAAAAYMLANGLDCPAIMQPADHYIPDVDRFRIAARLAADGAQRGFIVTFGISPTHPETSYGYISAGEPVPDCAGVTTVRRFVEKPSKHQAADYLAQGFVWNSGMFAFRPSTLLDELRKFEPQMADAVTRAVAQASQDGGSVRLDPIAFGEATKKSLDHAVMEHTARAAVVAGDFAWSDLGAWNAIYKAHPGDEQGNVVLAETSVVLDSERCFVRAGPIPVALIGLTDVGVIVEPDGIVVCRLDASASVKTAVDAFRTRARPESLRSRPPLLLSADFTDLRSASETLTTWLWHSALPLWWTIGADHERGGFFELIDESGSPVRAARRIRVQARQTYVYAKAGLAGWPGPWRAAVSHGLESIDSAYRRPDGFYRTLAADDGTPVDDTAFLYDQAFVLLALAAAAKAGVEPQRSADMARELRTVLLQRCARDGGGFSEQPLRGSTFQSNPHMHLLEAALEWCETDAEPGWQELADSLARLCLTRFVDPAGGMLREFFDEAGRPMDGLAGRIVEPGHQFEWSWLLLRWAAMRNDSSARTAALRLSEIGESHGIDPLRGVAIDALLDDFSQYSRQARLWPQTERLKAALAVADHSGDGQVRAVAEGRALAAAQGIAHYLHTRIPGLWHDKMRADGTFVREPSPASSLYHICGAILYLREYAGRQATGAP